MSLLDRPELTNQLKELGFKIGERVVLERALHAEAAAQAKTGGDEAIFCTPDCTPPVWPVLPLTERMILAIRLEVL